MFRGKGISEMGCGYSARINFLNGADCACVVCARVSAAKYNSGMENYRIKCAFLTYCDGNGAFFATGRVKLVRELSLAITARHLEHVTC